MPTLHLFFCNTLIERIISKNNQGVVVNQSKIDKFNFCPNSHRKIEENEDVISDDKILIEFYSVRLL